MSTSDPAVPDPRPPVEPLGQADPAAAVLAAYAEGRRLRLPTSGTASTPRSVVRSAASWGDSFGPVAELVGLRADARAWVPGPLTATMNLYAAALVRHVGASQVDRSQDASHVFCTPARMPELGPGGGRRVVVAGARLDPGTAARAVADGWRVSHYYGAAELSFVAWGGHAEDLRPFPGTEVEVRNGEIWVRSPWVAEGVPGSAAGWVSVGDRGRLTPDGRLLVDGRPGTVVTAGATVLVADVEAALGGEVVVAGRPHPRWGEVVVAVCAAGADLAALRVAARTRLPPSHRPRDWVILPRLPLTPAGKVDRRAAAALVAR